jgi:hypothetical protein
LPINRALKEAAKAALFRQDLKMSPLPRILQRIEAGDRVKAYQDFYGGKRIVVMRRWMPLWRLKAKLSPDEWQTVRSALAKRRTPSDVGNAAAQ